MSETNIKPLIESAILTLEQILENRQALVNLNIQQAPEADHVYAEHNQILYLKVGLCANISLNQATNLGLKDFEPRHAEFSILFDEITTQWSKYSGSKYFPVPMPEHFSLDWERYSEPNKEFDEHDAREKAHAAYQSCVDECVNLYADDYGELRFELAEFALGKLKEKYDV